MKLRFIITSIFFMVITSATIYAGFFPIASVNSDWIWYRDITRSARAIKQLQRTSSGAGLPSLLETTTLSALSASDIQRGVLEELMYEKMIAQELERIDSSQDWDQRVVRDTEGLLTGRDNAALKQATRELYRLDLDDFKKLVLAPQIREELLRKELALRAKDPEGWLTAAFQNARVKIYFLDYEWRDGRLINI